MSNETLLYVCGIILAVSAVTVSLVGLKVKTFPGKAMPLVVGWFAIFVVASTTFAVLHAKDEDADKAKEVRYEKANERYEKEGGHVPQDEESALEAAEGSGSSGEAEGEGHSEEGEEEAGAEESPESAEEGAREEGEGAAAGAGVEEAGGAE